jgi:hydrogenase nickel incorporation protein HypA/HybF
MHEASLVKSLLKQLNELVAQHGGGRVSGIHVEIGVLAGIEPLLFSEAFQHERIGTLAADAELVINTVGLTCHCQGCQLDFVTDELRFTCPACGDNQIEIAGGDAVILHSFTLAPAVESEIAP